MEKRCVFCDIIAGKAPAKIIMQTDDVLVIQDIAPKASIHYLIMPKQHIAQLASLQDNDLQLAGNLFMTAQHLGATIPNAQAFRLIVNEGAAAGQRVFHLHVHFLAGSTLPGFE